MTTTEPDTSTGETTSSTTATDPDTSTGLRGGSRAGRPLPGAGMIPA